ncbi:hypothetical protein P4C99_03045 [Pontiellaceae bacterium B1224]|nr:hypothetical protein [Pontiellaceae bacterium B1224]
MNIQVSVKKKAHEDPQCCQTTENASAPQGMRDDPDAAKRPGQMEEDDLNHLGFVHNATTK